MFWILLALYFIACIIASIIGIGPTVGNPREWYWWERILTFPFWALVQIAEKVPFMIVPIILLFYVYSFLCMPLVWLYETYELWAYNRKKTG